MTRIINKTHRIINTPFGEVLLKNERTDIQGYHWVELYNGDNYDNYIGTCCCSIMDTDEIILEQIDELLNN